MKYYLSIPSLALALILGSVLHAHAEGKKLVIGATPVPHAEILEKAKPILAKKGIDLEVKVFSDYVIPNLALADKSIDANFFQHAPYLESFSKEKKLSLNSIAAVHFEPLALYSKKIKKLSALKDGDKIAVPNDVTNEARALILLQDNGIIKLRDPRKLTSTKADVVQFRVKIEIVELEAAQISRSFDSVTAAVLNGNYAIEAKLSPSKDAIIAEKADSVSAQTYANILVIRADDNRPELRELASVLKSKEIRQFIKEKYKGAVIPAE